MNTYPSAAHRPGDARFRVAVVGVMVIKLLSANADTFEITAAEGGFTLAMEDAIAEKHPWLLVEADDGGLRISAGDLENL